MFYGLSPVSGFGTGVVNVRRDPSHYSYCTHGLGQAEDRTTPHSTLQGFFWIPEQLGFSPKFTTAGSFCIHSDVRQSLLANICIHLVLRSMLT